MSHHFPNFYDLLNIKIKFWRCADNASQPLELSRSLHEVSQCLEDFCVANQIAVCKCTFSILTEEGPWWGPSPCTKKLREDYLTSLLATAPGPAALSVWFIYEYHGCMIDIISDMGR